MSGAGGISDPVQGSSLPMTIGSVTSEKTAVTDDVLSPNAASTDFSDPNSPHGQEFHMRQRRLAPSGDATEIFSNRSDSEKSQRASTQRMFDRPSFRQSLRIQPSDSMSGSLPTSDIVSGETLQLSHQILETEVTSETDPDAGLVEALSVNRELVAHQESLDKKYQEALKRATEGDRQSALANRLRDQLQGLQADLAKEREKTVISEQERQVAEQMVSKLRQEISAVKNAHLELEIQSMGYWKELCDLRQSRTQLDSRCREMTSDLDWSKRKIDGLEQEFSDTADILESYLQAYEQMSREIIVHSNELLQPARKHMFKTVLSQGPQFARSRVPILEKRAQTRSNRPAGSQPSITAPRSVARSSSTNDAAVASGFSTSTNDKETRSRRNTSPPVLTNNGLARRDSRTITGISIDVRDSMHGTQQNDPEKSSTIMKRGATATMIDDGSSSLSTTNDPPRVAIVITRTEQNSKLTPQDDLTTLDASSTRDDDSSDKSDPADISRGSSNDGAERAQTNNDLSSTRSIGSDDRPKQTQFLVDQPLTSNPSPNKVDIGVPVGQGGLSNTRSSISTGKRHMPLKSLPQDASPDRNGQSKSISGSSDVEASTNISRPRSSPLVSPKSLSRPQDAQHATNPASALQQPDRISTSPRQQLFKINKKSQESLDHNNHRGTILTSSTALQSQGLNPSSQEQRQIQRSADQSTSKDSSAPPATSRTGKSNSVSDAVDDQRLASSRTAVEASTLIDIQKKGVSIRKPLPHIITSNSNQNDPHSQSSSVNTADTVADASTMLERAIGSMEKFGTVDLTSKNRNGVTEPGSLPTNDTTTRTSHVEKSDKHETPSTQPTTSEPKTGKGMMSNVAPPVRNRSRSYTSLPSSQPDSGSTDRSFNFREDTMDETADRIKSSSTGPMVSTSSRNNGVSSQLPSQTSLAEDGMIVSAQHGHDPSSGTRLLGITRDRKALHPPSPTKQHENVQTPRISRPSSDHGLSFAVTGLNVPSNRDIVFLETYKLDSNARNELFNWGDRRLLDGRRLSQSRDDTVNDGAGTDDKAMVNTIRSKHSTQAVAEEAVEETSAYNTPLTDVDRQQSVPASIAIPPKENLLKRIAETLYCLAVFPLISFLNTILLPKLLFLNIVLQKHGLTGFILYCLAFIRAAALVSTGASWTSKLGAKPSVSLILAAQLLYLFHQVSQTHRDWLIANTSEMRDLVMDHRENYWQWKVLVYVRWYLQMTIERRYGQGQHFVST